MSQPVVTTLGSRLHEIISRGIKMHGTFNPDRILYVFEESLTGPEVERIVPFLQWCHDRQMPFGHGNYEARYTQFLTETGASADAAAPPEQTTEQRWTTDVAKHLQGRTIKAVRYLNADEMKSMGWFRSAVVLELDDGNSIWPSADDEGNDAGALFTTFPDLATIPVI